MRLPQHIYDLVLANMLFGVSYSVVVSLLERNYSPNQLFTVQVIAGFIIFMPYLNLKKISRHVPHIIRNTSILLFGWQRLTLIGSQHISPLTIAAISLVGIVVTLLAARNIHHLRIFCIPLIAAVLTLPCCNVAHEWLIFCGVVCVAVSTILSRDMMRELGATTLLAGYFLVALTLLPALHHITATPQLTSTLHIAHGRDMLLLLFQSTLGSALPLYLLLRGSAHSTPLTTALCRYIQSVIAIAVFYIPDLCNVLILMMFAIVAIEVFAKSCDDVV